MPGVKAYLALPFYELCDVQIIHHFSKTMVRVAVAGGTGHVGQSLVDGLVESKEHDVFVLTRKVISHVAIVGASPSFA